jgi:hypothetical protein
MSSSDEHQDKKAKRDVQEDSEGFKILQGAIKASDYANF